MDMLSAGGGHPRTANHLAGAPATSFAAALCATGDGIDHLFSAPHPGSVDPEPIPPSGGGDGQRSGEPQCSSAVAIIVALWRQRQDIARAYQRLDLQCQAVVRRYSGGDKAVAAKRWAAIQKGADDEVAAILTPYQLAMEPLAEARAALEKQLEKRARALPIWSGWAKDVRGVGALSLAGLIGEAGIAIGEYLSVSGLWKRMGLAVIGGERQRRVAGAEQALIHGYAPQRRSFAYVLSTSLMRAQRGGEEYRAIYDARKAYELAREIPKAHAHNRAQRVMVKALLRDAWVADRRLRRDASIGPNAHQAQAEASPLALGKA